jgi:hypothetical protein
MDSGCQRPWFQFHLITAFVLMFAASGLLWANITLRDAVIATTGGCDSSEVRTKGYGWPLFVQYKHSESYTTTVDVPRLLIDAICAVFVLMIVAFCSEGLLRIHHDIFHVFPREPHPPHEY